MACTHSHDAQIVQSISGLCTVILCFFCLCVFLPAPRALQGFVRDAKCFVFFSVWLLGLPGWQSLTLVSDILRSNRLEDTYLLTLTRKASKVVILFSLSHTRSYILFLLLLTTLVSVFVSVLKHHIVRAEIVCTHRYTAIHRALELRLCQNCINNDVMI